MPNRHLSNPIVTSIPPVFSRKDAQGQEIGDAYLARCVQSWRACGFDPVTVNSVNETLHPMITELGIEVVRVVRVPRDAAAITGRPHVFLDDLLQAARDMSADRVFIVNADIELEMDAAARDRLTGLGPMQALAMRRRDHSGQRELAKPTYDCGIDLFGAGHQALADIRCGNLVFGMPWWDDYLPMMLLWRGAEFVSGKGVRVWHLDHDGRWNKRQYIGAGREFLHLLDQTEPALRRNPQVDRHIARLARIRRGHYGASLPRRIEARMVANLMPFSRTHIRRVLRETAASNIYILDIITASH